MNDVEVIFVTDEGEESYVVQWFSVPIPGSRNMVVCDTREEVEKLAGNSEIEEYDLESVTLTRCANATVACPLRDLTETVWVTVPPRSLSAIMRQSIASAMAMAPARGDSMPLAHTLTCDVIAHLWMAAGYPQRWDPRECFRDE